MASEDPNRGQGGRRMPKTPQDLLALCAEHTDPNNPNENVSFETMEPEKKEWLEQALVGMSVNPASEMKSGVDCILNEESDTDARLDALDKLIEWCENLDFAIDFHKVGGFQIFPHCAADDDAEVRSQALELVATLVQNNPYCQKATLDYKMLPTLLHTLDTDGSTLVRRKALYALSCLVRECQEALDVFIENDGFSALMRALQTGDEKIKIKTAFMISGVCTHSDKCKDILCDMGMIQQLVGHLSEEHSSFHEHLMSALLTIVRDHPRSIQECTQPQLGLHTLLKQKQQDLKGQEQYQECSQSQLGLHTLLKQKQQDLKGQEQYREEYEYVTELQQLLGRTGDGETDVAR